jgi:hypothetical protein
MLRRNPLDRGPTPSRLGHRIAAASCQMTFDPSRFSAFRPRNLRSVHLMGWGDGHAVLLSGRVARDLRPVVPSFRIGRDMPGRVRSGSGTAPRHPKGFHGPSSMAHDSPPCATLRMPPDAPHASLARPLSHRQIVSRRWAPCVGGVRLCPSGSDSGNAPLVAGGHACPS